MSTDTKLKDVLGSEPEKDVTDGSTSTEEKKPEVKKEEKKATAATTKKESKAEEKKEKIKNEEKKATAAELKEEKGKGAIIKRVYSDGVKIYSAPDLKSASILFQGVIEFKGKLSSGFNKISYISISGELAHGYVMLSKGEI